MLNLLDLCSIIGTTKPRSLYNCLQHGLLNILSSLLRPTTQKKMTSFKIWLLTDNEPGHLRALMEMYNDISAVFMPENKTSILQPMGQGVISTFKCLYFKNIFCKAMAATDNDPSYGSGQSQLKTSGKDSSFQIPWRTFVSWEEVKISTLAGV